MTIEECVKLVRVLLDDSRDWFPTTEEIINALNEAQLKKIHEFYSVGDERALRPLYRETDYLVDGAQVIDANGMHCLYPRTCRAYETVSVPDRNSLFLNHQPNQLYFNYTAPGYDAGQSFPRAGYYTVLKQWDAVNLAYSTFLYFTGPVGAVAKLWYISHPLPVMHAITAPDIDLSLPAEYHPEVCTFAAEILNDMDVGEMERGAMAIPGQQRLTIEIAGGTGG